MKTRSAVLALTLLIAAGAAQAADPPSIRSVVIRPPDDNVVVIAVNDVQVPATLPGQCLARGVVSQVVSGKQFHAGQSLAIKVACGHRTPIIDSRPATRDGDASIDAMILSRAKKAVVRLDDTGAVIWRPTAAFGENQNGQYKGTYGYVVLDGVMLPLRSQAS
jgi:hypothetical protein